MYTSRVYARTLKAGAGLPFLPAAGAGVDATTSCPTFSSSAAAVVLDVFGRFDGMDSMVHDAAAAAVTAARPPQPRCRMARGLVPAFHPWHGLVQTGIQCIYVPCFRSASVVAMAPCPGWCRKGADANPFVGLGAYQGQYPSVQDERSKSLQKASRSLVRVGRRVPVPISGGVGKAGVASCLPQPTTGARPNR